MREGAILVKTEQQRRDERKPATVKDIRTKRTVF